MSRVKKVFAVVCTSAMLAAVPASTAAAAQQNQDGLVNVAVGDVTALNNVSVQAAVDAVVQACDLADVGNVQAAVLARATAVDRGGHEQTICRSGEMNTTQGTQQGPITISNNI
jgi:hypothetical protein